MSVGYATDESKPQESKSKDPYPEFETLQAWEAAKSTKMDTCAKICLHMLTSDDAPDIIFEDGQATFPHIPPPPPGAAKKQETKILIYQEFTSLRRLLLRVSIQDLSF